MSQFSCYDYYLYVHQIIVIFINIINLIIQRVILYQYYKPLLKLLTGIFWVLY